MDKAFVRSVQNFQANAFSIAIVRNMGPGGTLDCIREFLKEIDLTAVSKIEPSQYIKTLNDLTEKLRRSMPKDARNWGVARKCLNLFFRDALYNYYLRRAYDLAKFESNMEIPLDSYVGRALRCEPEGEYLPRWRTVTRLSQQESDDFQAVAGKVGKRRGTAKVHLDIEYWRGEPLRSTVVTRNQ